MSFIVFSSQLTTNSWSCQSNRAPPLLQLLCQNVTCQAETPNTSSQFFLRSHCLDQHAHPLASALWHDVDPQWRSKSSKTRKLVSHRPLSFKHKGPKSLFGLEILATESMEFPGVFLVLPQRPAIADSSTNIATYWFCLIKINKGSSSVMVLQYYDNTPKAVKTKCWGSWPIAKLGKYTWRSFVFDSLLPAGLVPASISHSAPIIARPWGHSRLPHASKGKKMKKGRSGPYELQDIKVCGSIQLSIVHLTTVLSTSGVGELLHWWAPSSSCVLEKMVRAIMFNKKDVCTCVIEPQKEKRKTLELCHANSSGLKPVQTSRIVSWCFLWAKLLICFSIANLLPATSAMSDSAPPGDRLSAPPCEPVWCHGARHPLGSHHKDLLPLGGPRWSGHSYELWWTFMNLSKITKAMAMILQLQTGRTPWLKGCNATSLVLESSMLRNLVETRDKSVALMNITCTRNSHAGLALG